jgi:intraflagellar transport protein 80
VIGRRQQYLEQTGRTESSKKFLQYSDSVQIDWEAINSKIQLELENERKRPGAKPL